MLGNMMEVPLNVLSIIRHAACNHPPGRDCQLSALFIGVDKHWGERGESLSLFCQ